MYMQHMMWTVHCLIEFCDAIYALQVEKGTADKDYNVPEPVSTVYL